MNRFIILRTEQGEWFSTRGPMAKSMSLEDATAEVKRLKARYPAQNFAIFAEVGSAVRTESVGVHLRAPDLSMPLPEGATPITAKART